VKGSKQGILECACRIAGGWREYLGVADRSTGDGGYPDHDAEPDNVRSNLRESYASRTEQSGNHVVEENPGYIFFFARLKASRSSAYARSNPTRISSQTSPLLARSSLNLSRASSYLGLTLS
jgi:hypothetical protein